MKHIKNQGTLINKHIGSCRFVYNWVLEQKIQTYEQAGKSINHRAWINFFLLSKLRNLL
ncbi:MAG TPA: helix-turn-helix domain-containing protein [Methanosarcina sp.]|nr:helix-turn-helix domain-containing protein [Methanosarcina sp.]